MVARRLGPVLLAMLAAVGGFKAIPAVASFPIDVTLIAEAAVLVAFAWIVVVTGRFSVLRPVGRPLLVLATLAPPVLWSSWSGYSTTKITLLFTVTATCVLAPVVLVKNRRQLWVLLGSVGAVGAVMVPAALAGLTDTTTVRATAFDASALHVATFGGLAFVMTTLWGLSSKRRAPAALIAAVASLVAIIGSGTRAAVAGALAALLVVLVAARGQDVRRVVQVILLVPAVAAAVAFGMSAAPDQAQSRLASAAYDLSGDRSTAARIDAWEQSVGVIGAHPFGVGIGDWPQHTNSTLNYPHNLVLEVGAEAGWVALTALLAYLFVAYRNVWLHSNQQEGRMLLGVLTFLLLQAMARGDITSQRLLFVVASVCLVLPEVMMPHPSERKSIPAASRDRYR